MNANDVTSHFLARRGIPGTSCYDMMTLCEFNTRRQSPTVLLTVAYS